MKKALFILCVAVLLTACSSSTNDTGKQGIASKAQEYTFAELKDVVDGYIDEYLEEMSKLSDAELYGLSDDEESKNKNYWKVSNSISNKILEDCEIPQGQKVIVTGYIVDVAESKEDAFLFDRDSIEYFSI